VKEAMVLQPLTIEYEFNTQLFPRYMQAVVDEIVVGNSNPQKVKKSVK